MTRYEHPLIIYELDGVLADCAVRETEVLGLHHKKGSFAYRKILFDPRRLRQDLLVDKARDLTRQLWKDRCKVRSRIQHKFRFWYRALCWLMDGGLAHHP